MSSSRRTPYGWAPHEAQQQTQYGGQGGVDQITAGMSGVSLQNPPYGHGTGFGNVPYPADGQYYGSTSYGYPQDPSYSTQEGGYSQAAGYSTEPQYSQAPQYTPGDSYDYPAIDNAGDQNSQYTTNPRQQYPSHPKGKSKAVDPATSKPKNSRDKPRDHGKGKSSASKPGRSRSGKTQLEEESTPDDDDITPFYKPPSHGPSEQDNSNLDQPHQDETTTVGASADGSLYDNDYPTAAQPSNEQVVNYEAHQEESSGVVYEEAHSNSNYPGGRSTGSRQPVRAETQSGYPSAYSDPYPPTNILENIDDYGYMPAGGSHPMEDNSMIGASANYPQPVYEDGAGIATPRATTPQVTISSTAVGQAELDARFIVEPSSRFYPGDVFKVLWSEPMGAGRGDMTEAETRSHMGERFYVGIRRFIIVRTDEGHSTCVPILTYERRACKKRGVKPRTHGIIYPEGSKPRLLDGEPPLGCKPVKIELHERSERIVKESRVNYSKLVTVEHNIKVFFIGRVAPEHLYLIDESVNQCWDHKNRLSQSKGGGGKHYQSYRPHR